MKSSHLACFSGRVRNCPTRFAVAFSFALVGLTSAAQAQIATVGVIERTVEKRTGAGAWADAKKGEKLSQGDGLRTGKRSKADALFRDGSLVRLGQLSSLDIQSGNAEATRVRLQDGRIILVKKPGSGGTARVLTGTGAAEIKGSVVYVRANRDGSAEYANYSGQISIVGLNAQGVETQRVQLPPGRLIKTFIGGLVSPITAAPPLNAQAEMLEKPVNSPLPGSQTQVIARLEPGVDAIDKSLPPTVIPNLDVPRVNPFIPHGPLPDGQPPIGGPFPTPVPTPGGTGGTGGTGTARARTGLLASTPQMRGQSMAGRIAAPIYLAQANPAPAINPGQAAQNLGQSTNETITPTDDFGPTYRHFANVNRQLGRESGIDYRATGFFGSRSLIAGIGQLHAFAKDGTLAADIAINPQDIRFDTPTRRIRRTTAVISHATLTYQSQMGSVIVGRQRFLSGPIRASYFGSMTRAGGREVMDALRFVPHISEHYGAEFSYLYDAYPRELAFGARGHQPGFLGRVYTQQKFGNFGLNLLRYKDSPVADRTGVTLDFTLPVLTKKLEFYGEVGTDPFKRKLRTFGFNSPLLYEKTGFDLYVERAKLNTSGSAAGIGDEWAVRLYRSLNNSVDFVGAYNHFNGGNSTFLLGFSVGGEAVFPGR